MIGLGCMRLSTAADRDRERALAVIHAALDAGATLLDTAAAYGQSEHEMGHNERLVAEALRTWAGERTRVEVATKGGMRRPGGAWVPDGRAKQLRADCEASLRALGVAVIDLYQLHAVDARTPFPTSVRALASLQREGLVRRIGLCNVTVNQITAARELVEVASVQVSLSVLDDENLRNGVAEYCREHSIRLTAYRPLGGERAERVGRDATLLEVARRHAATPWEVALAWLRDLGVVPLAGATRVESASSFARVLALRLTDADRAMLDQRFGGRLLRIPRAQRRPAPGARGDVVLVMGMPGAGKSAAAAEFVARGYERLNRDERGGTLAALARALDAGLRDGRRSWVLDNTYPTRRARSDVIETAWQHGVPVRCVHVTTGLADAQVNAITRLIEVHGRLPTPDELRARGREDARYFGPDAQFHYERTFEAPAPDEGFAEIEQRRFERRPDPSSVARALVLDFDELVQAASEAGVRDALLRRQQDGWLLLAQAWRPQIARGDSDVAEVRTAFAHLREQLGAAIELAICPHDAGPPICWCRRPLPGLPLEFGVPRRVRWADSLLVGSAAADRTQAQRLGARYAESVAALMDSR